MSLMKQRAWVVGAATGEVFPLVVQALTEISATLERSDEAAGLILAKKGIGLTSYGEVLRVWVVAQEDRATQITVQSELTAGFQLVDWGKNDGNLNDLAHRLSALLSERGLPALREIAMEPPAPPSLPAPSDELAPLPPPSIGAGSVRQPKDFFSRPSKDRSIALLLEIGPGIGGLYGIGWLYSGKTTTGVMLLVGTLLWSCIVGVIAASTGGLACLCTVPVNIVIMAVSAYNLNNYAKSHPEMFSV